jgi:hypothetical protein
LVRPLQEAITGALEKIQFNPNLPRTVVHPAQSTAPIRIAEVSHPVAAVTGSGSEMDLTARLQRLKSLKEADLISDEEFQAQRQRILAEL